MKTNIEMIRFGNQWNVVDVMKTLKRELYNFVVFVFMCVMMPMITGCHSKNNHHSEIKYNIGDTIKFATPEGIEMTFLMTYSNTLQVGNSHDACIDINTQGIVTIPNEVNGYPVVTIAEYAFKQCNNLSEIVLPSSIKDIESLAFSSTSIERIVIPENVEHIGSQIFLCPMLKEIKVSKDNQIYDSRDNCNAIIETKTNTLCYGCINTKIPLSITRIGDDAFNEVGLKQIVIPEGVKSIGNRAFMLNDSVTKVVIPNTVDSIGMYAFAKLFNLLEINIPANVKFIGEGAFSWCYAKHITVDEKNRVYDSRNGCNAIVESKTNKLISGFSTTTIPEGVESIGEAAFLYQGGYNAKTFHKLTLIVLPKSLKSIEDRAFAACDSLTVIVSKIEKPFEIGENAFNYNEHQILYVPERLLDIYQKTPHWNKFKIHTFK